MKLESKSDDGLACGRTGDGDGERNDEKLFAKVIEREGVPGAHELPVDDFGGGGSGVKNEEGPGSVADCADP